MRRRHFSFVCLVACIALGFGMSQVQAEPIDVLYGDPGLTMPNVWSGNYVDLAGDGTTVNRFAGIKATGGVDVLYHSNGGVKMENAWLGMYTSIAGDPNYSNYLAAKASGGVDVLYVAGTAENPVYEKAENRWTGTYSDLAAERSRSNALAGIKAAGGVDVLYWDGAGQTVTNAWLGTYTSITADAETQNAFFAAKAGGGVDVLYYGSTGYEKAENRWAGTYTDLATDAIQPNRLVGIKADGGVDLLYWDYPAGAAVTVENFWAGKYTSITADTTVGDRYYAQQAAIPVPVSWTGIGDTTWSTASGLNNNWKDSGGTTANYADGADVTFDDTATGTAVDVSAADVSPTSVTFNNSSLNFTITGTKGIAGATGVVKQGTGTVTLNSVNTYSGVTTIQAGTLQMSESSYSNVATNGGVDIQGGKGILDYSLSGTSPALEVQALLAASYNNGAWNVGQIRNTTAATTGLSLGWADDTTAQQLTIMATYAGDANVDGTTDVADLTALLNNYNKTGMVWADGNFDYDVDGVVNVADLTALLNNYNKSVGGSVMAGLSVGGSAVPEPGTIVLLSTGLLGMLAYAWRKQK